MSGAVLVHCQTLPHQKWFLHSNLIHISFDGCVTKLIHCPWQLASSEKKLLDLDQFWHADTRLLISMCRHHQRRVSKVILTELCLTWAKGYGLTEVLNTKTCCVMKVRWKGFVSLKCHYCPLRFNTTRGLTEWTKCIIPHPAQTHKITPTDVYYSLLKPGQVRCNSVL